MSGIREKMKIGAKNMTEPGAPITNPKPKDRSRGFKLLKLVGRSPPTARDIAFRVQVLLHNNRFLHTIDYENTVRFAVFLTERNSQECLAGRCHCGNIQEPVDIHLDL